MFIIIWYNIIVNSSSSNDKILDISDSSSSVNIDNELTDVNLPTDISLLCINVYNKYIDFLF